jgi:hypothetical protein
MRKRSSVVVAAAAGMLALGAALPVAADAAVTPVVVTVSGGTLSITAPVASVLLGNQVDTVAGGTVSGLLGPVQVLDARSAAAGSGWIATVISTALTPTAGPTIGAALIGYTAGSITKVGTATFYANNPPDLTGVAAAVTASGITGNNSASWIPTINVAVPGGTVAGVYTGTITHSVT